MKRNAFNIITILSVTLLVAAAVHAASGTPAAPEGLGVTIAGEKGFLLKWKASADDPGTVTGYEIVRANVASGPFKKVGKVKKGVFEYHDKSAKPEIIYFYKVRAVAGKSYSDYSQPAAGERPGM